MTKFVCTLLVGLSIYVVGVCVVYVMLHAVFGNVCAWICLCLHVLYLNDFRWIHLTLSSGRPAVLLYLCVECVYVCLHSTPPPPTHTPPSSAHQKKAPCPLHLSRTWTACNKAGLWLGPHFHMTKFPWLSLSGRGVLCFLELGTQALESIVQAPTPGEFLIVGGWNIHPLEAGTPSPGSGRDGEVAAPYTTFVWCQSAVDGDGRNLPSGLHVWGLLPLRSWPQSTLSSHVALYRKCWGCQDPTTQGLSVGDVPRAKRSTKPFTHYLIWFSKQLYEMDTIADSILKMRKLKPSKAK